MAITLSRSSSILFIKYNFKTNSSLLVGNSVKGSLIHSSKAILPVFVKDSQIYPELSKLTKKGWIDFQTEIVGTKLEKKVYSLTKTGRMALLEWINESSLFL
jgi:hypothetical protein